MATLKQKLNRLLPHPGYNLGTGNAPQPTAMNRNIVGLGNDTGLATPRLTGSMAPANPTGANPAVAYTNRSPDPYYGDRLNVPPPPRPRIKRPDPGAYLPVQNQIQEHFKNLTQTNPLFQGLGQFQFGANATPEQQRSLDEYLLGAGINPYLSTNYGTPGRLSTMGQLNAAHYGWDGGLVAANDLGQLNNPETRDRHLAYLYGMMPYQGGHNYGSGSTTQTNPNGTMTHADYSKYKANDPMAAFTRDLQKAKTAEDYNRLLKSWGVNDAFTPTMTPEQARLPWMLQNLQYQIARANGPQEEDDDPPGRPGSLAEMFRRR